MQGPSISLYVIGFLLAAICGSVYYLLKKLVPSFNRAFRYTYIALTASALGFAFFNRVLYALGLPPILSMIAVWWMAGLFIMLPFLLFWRGLAAVEQRTRKKAGEDISRRDFIRKSAAAVPLVALGVSAKGVYGAGEVTIQRHDLKLANFPKDLGKVKLVQISDSHIGPFFGINSLEQALKLSAAENPDLVVITGDLIDDLNLLDQTINRLTKLQAALPYGMYFAWGNHEYFRDRSKIRRALAQSPIVVLENSAAQISQGENPLFLLGVDYPWAKNTDEMRSIKQSYLQQSLEKVPESACKILLSHHPDFIDNAFQAGIPLTLTGHTHGGQVNVAGHSLLPVQYKYMRGLYRQGDLAGYVSTGTGNWLPFRLGCPAEISVFTLSALS